MPQDPKFILIDALANSVGDQPISVTDEELALAASGKTDRLPAGDRVRLLNAIAADPVLVATVLETHRALVQGGLHINESDADSPGQPIAPEVERTRGPVLFKFTSVVWAMAACLALCFGAIHFSQTPQSAFDTSLSFEQASSQYDTTTASRPKGPAFYLFIGGAVLTGLLTIPVVYRIVRPRPRQTTNSR